MNYGEYARTPYYWTEDCQTWETKRLNQFALALNRKEGLNHADAGFDYQAGGLGFGAAIVAIAVYKKLLLCKRPKVVSSVEEPLL